MVDNLFGDRDFMGYPLDAPRRHIFVFGSNLAGRHGAGSALHAAKHFGAERGIGEGRTGEAYAIPTKDSKLRVLPLCDIQVGVDRFIAYARANPDLAFDIVKIGCGLAGYKDDQIAPMFANALDNCVLPEGWR